jgi:peptide/nickel transport system permease protein
LLRRAGQALVTLVIAIILAFILMRLAPGDPLARLSQDRPLTAKQIAELRERFGLDRPLTDQLASFAAGVARGDLGTSIQYGRPVTSLIAERLPATLLLGGAVLLLNFTVGVWLGVKQAVRRNSVMDQALTVVSLAGYATPSFWLGLILAWIVGVKWHLLPAAGMVDPLLDPGAGPLARAADVGRHLLLPALTLSVVSIAATMRYQRSAMIEVLHLPYIMTARAKGLAESDVTWRHAWRNAFFPVLTLFGLWLPLLVTGSVFVESVFAWPGLGSLAVGAVGYRDYPLLMGCALLVAIVVVTASLLTDLAYAFLDPRVRLS